MGMVNGVLSGVKEKVNRLLYTSEYIKDLDRVSLQYRHSGNSYCGEYKKRSRKNLKPYRCG